MNATLMAWFSPATQADKDTASLVGERRSLWAYILTQLEDTPLDDEERRTLVALAQGRHWMDMVSTEHKEIYRAICAERGKQQQHVRLAMDGGRVVVMGDAKIARDVPRTFGVFENNMWDKMRLKMEKKERFSALNRVLHAIQSITGSYCQGQNFIAGLILMELSDEGDAFTVLAWILRELHLQALFEGQGVGLAAYAAVFDVVIRQQLPRLHAHLQSQCFGPLLFTVEWFSTLFSISTHRTVALCAFDLFLCQVSHTPLRLAVALLAEAERDLLRLDSEGLQLNFKRLISRLPPDRVLVRALQVVIPPFHGSQLADIRMDMERGLIADDHEVTSRHFQHQQRRKMEGGLRRHEGARAREGKVEPSVGPGDEAESGSSDECSEAGPRGRSDEGSMMEG